MKNIALILLLIFPGYLVHAQVIQWSTYLNTTGNEVMAGATKDAAGNIYILGSTDANGFPVTAGAFQSTLNPGTQKMVISKLSGATGSVIWSTYLGGDNDLIRPGKIYFDATSNTINVTASSKSGNFPIVNGNPKVSEAIYAPSFTQFNPSTGTVIFSTHVFNILALNQSGSVLEYKTEFKNGFAYFLSIDATYHSVLVSKISLITHQFVYQKAVTGTNGTLSYVLGASSLGFDVDNGEVYVSGITSATDFPTTSGSYQPVFPSGEADAYFITKLNASGNIAFSTYANSHPANFFALFSQIAVSPGANELATARAYNNGIPVSPGGLPFDNNEDMNLGVLKLNKTDGSLIHFSYLGGNSENDILPIRGLKYSGNNDLIIYGNSLTGYLPVTPNAIQPYNSFHLPNGIYAGDCFFIHINAANQIAYCSYLGGNETDAIYSISQDANNNIYFAGVTNSNNFPVTPNATQSVNKGSSLNSPGELFFTKYNLITRSITYSSYLGTNVYDIFPSANGAFQITTTGENIFTNAVSNYALGQSIGVDFPVTADAFQPTLIGSSNQAFHQYLAKINTATGKLEYGSYIGSLVNGNGENSHALIENGDDVFLGGETLANDYPVTVGAVRTNYAGNNDIFITKLSLCYNDVISDTLMPKHQLICLGSLVDSIIGSVPQFAHTATLLRNGITQASQINQTNFTYQWQESNDSISWTFINGATEKDYLPGPVTAKKYFRRIAKPAFCDYTDTSSVSTVSLSGIIAVKPDVGNDGSFFSCPGSNITLGTPVVPGFSYTWLPASQLSSSNTAQTVFNNIVPGAYTYVLFATGPNGCTGTDTASVYNYAANAGPDKVMCQGLSIQIGGMPLAGITGVTYTWTPTTGLSCSNCSQPLVTTTGTYTLTVNVPLPGGGNCITTDAVTITASSLPNNPGGPDITTCNAIPVVLGTPRVPGYTYNWTPGILLSAIADTAQPIYNNLNATIYPIYNPIKYTLTASNPVGCTVIDTVKVFVVDVYTGEGGCRPVQLGRRDHSGGLATYQWVDVSSGSETPVGPGELSSTTISNPVALANPAINVQKTYRLKMTWNGVTCFEDVTVNVICPCPEIKLRFQSNNNCPTVSGLDSVIIYVKDPSPEYIYSWSPATGLNTTVGPIVKTGAASSIIYTCTATNIHDTSLHCYKSIKINFFNTTAPVFDAPDRIICKNSTGNIGLPSVAGLDYAWTSSLSPNGISNISDPVVTGLTDIFYYVEVTDAVTGCYVDDTVKVHVPDIPIEAGPTRASCTGGGFTIGTPAISGLTYQWFPSTGLDNPNTAQPMVVSNDADITYVLIVTDVASGCIASDAVSLQHTDAPFLDTITAPTAYCEGSNTSVQIGNPALNGVTYSWSPAVNLNNTGIAQPLANPSVTTTYIVTAHFTGACTSNATQSVTVTVIPKPTALASVVNNCINSQLNVTTNSTNPNYYWSPVAGLDNPYIANPVSTTNVPVNYTVNIYDFITGCSNSSIATVMPPVVSNAGTDQELCKGNVSPLGVAPLPGVTYSWLPANGLSNYNTSNPTTLSSLPVGTYTYTLTAISGGCTKTDNVIIKVNALPNVNVGSGVTICKDAAVQIGVSPQPGVSYSWSPSIGLSNVSISNPIASPLTTTTYILTATNILNNCTDHASITVTVNTTGAPVVNATAAHNTCPGEAVQLNTSVSGSGIYTYVWSPLVNFLSSAFISNPIVAPTVTTTYHVLVTNSANGCSNTATATVTVKDTCNVPVTWLGFTAVLQNKKTLLNWSVAMEQNNKEFVAERSTDGIHWKPLFKIPGLGNTSIIRTYNGIDPTPVNGINFYRIKQVDLDGTFTYSVIRSVRLGDDEPLFIVYPNPAHDVLNYQLLNTGSIIDLDLLLHSADGKLLRKQHLTSNIGNISIYDLPAGMYIVTVRDSKGRIENKKVIVQK